MMLRRFYLSENRNGERSCGIFCRLRLTLGFALSLFSALSAQSSQEGHAGPQIRHHPSVALAFPPFFSPTDSVVREWRVGRRGQYYGGSASVGS